MDHTALFRACVKAMRVRKKNLQIRPASPPSIRNDDFVVQAKKLNSLITELREFLINRRKDYINSCHILSQYSRLTDADRDKIDAETEAAIRNCNKMLGNLAQIAKFDRQATDQVRQHRTAVVSIIQTYLSGTKTILAVIKIYSEQRAIRVKRAADMKRMSRLSSLLRNANSFVASKSSVISNEDTDKHRQSTSRSNEPSTSASDSVETTSAGGLRKRRTFVDDGNGMDNDSTDKKPSTISVKIDYESLDRKYTDEAFALSETEKNEFAIENEQLYKRVNLMTDDIEQIEGKMVEIARLQEVFANEVIEQDATIEHVYETAVHSTENLNYGNEQIREAMKRQAGMRVWIMFSLLVLTFTLWFLDWYNP